LTHTTPFPYTTLFRSHKIESQRTPRKSHLLIACACFLFFCLPGAPGFQSPVVHYTVSLANPASHRVHVRIEIPLGAAQRELQLRSEEHTSELQSPDHL